MSICKGYDQLAEHVESEQYFKDKDAKLRRLGGLISKKYKP